MAVAAAASAQKTDRYLYKGNELYKKQEFEKSLEQYKQALNADPKSPIANFNQGNALFRQQKFDDATQSFNQVIENAPDNPSKEQAYYNKGVTAIKQNKLEESVDAWKNALRLDPTDQQARENLQKALRELKKQQQQQQQNKQNKDQQKQQQKNQQDQQQQQPPPQSKLSKQRVEQLLKALQQKEKEVQDRLQKEKVAAPRRPDKDW
jgi:tetratricopeptide (TPR) repeat protein